MGRPVWRYQFPGAETENLSYWICLGTGMKGCGDGRPIPAGYLACTQTNLKRQGFLSRHRGTDTSMPGWGIGTCNSYFWVEI